MSTYIGLHFHEKRPGVRAADHEMSDGRRFSSLHIDGDGVQVTLFMSSPDNVIALGKEIHTLGLRLQAERDQAIAKAAG